ncbi:hypothetical protein SANTM175S_00011 [Streptomyces antimycoticus]
MPPLPRSHAWLPDYLRAASVPVAQAATTSLMDALGARPLVHGPLS